MGIKIKQPSPPPRPPVSIRAPAEKAGLPLSGGDTDRAQRESSPDGPRAGYTVGADGRRQYKDEIPYPAADVPRKPYRVR